jgi:hypothetical protein
MITAALALCPAPVLAAPPNKAKVAQVPVTTVAPAAPQTLPPLVSPVTGVGPTGTPLYPAVQTEMSYIDPATNTIPIGTAYRGWNEFVSSSTIFDHGPGNTAGANYAPAFLVGDFSHCGYIVASTSRPKQTGSAQPPDPSDLPTCSSLPLGNGGSFHAYFKATYTNGKVNFAGADGQPITLDMNKPECTSQNGDGNVLPWLPQNEPELDRFPLKVPSNGIIHGTWRYFSRSGEFIWVHVPGQRQSWFYVDSGCAHSLG